MRTLVLLPLLVACVTTLPTGPEGVEPEPSPVVQAKVTTMAGALDHAGRTDEDKARDSQRHPAATLGFFGVKTTDHVLELWAGGGWYSRILAPYLSAEGHLHVTQYAQDAEPSYRADAAKRWEAYRTEHGLQSSTSTITVTADNPQLGLTNAVDVVITFRNVHNWVKADTDASLYAQSFAALKPGGTFGIVEHRAVGMTREKSAESGYMDPQAVIDAVTAAGFVFEEASEINANPKDTHDHPEGVWTLPPSFALKDVDREKYAAIGESDRMTLRFRKPME